MARQLELEELEHVYKVLEKLTDPEDKYLLLMLVCEHGYAYGEVEGLKIALESRDKK